MNKSKVIEVLATTKIGHDTAVVAKNEGISLQKGMAILDDNGKPHIIDSIGTTRATLNCPEELRNAIDLLIKGNFSSTNIYI